MTKKYIILFSIILIFFLKKDVVCCLEPILTEEIKKVIFDNCVIVYDMNKYCNVKSILCNMDCAKIKILYQGLENLNSIAEIHNYAQEVMPKFFKK